MKNIFSQYAVPAIVLTISAIGITAAAVTPLPPFTNVENGNIIDASHINNMIQSLSILDQRTDGDSPVDNVDLVNKGYLESSITDFTTVSDVSTAITTATSNFVTQNDVTNQINNSTTNISTPINGTDAVNKDYVDAAVSAAGDWLKGKVCPDGEIFQGYNTDGTAKCETPSSLGIIGGNGGTYIPGSINLGDGATADSYFGVGGSPHYCLKTTATDDGLVYSASINNGKNALQENGKKYECNNGELTNYGLDSSNESIQWKGLGYGTITSDVSGRIWLDRNLGARRICTTETDEHCLGDAFQWGRGHDGHQLDDSFILSSAIPWDNFSSTWVNISSDWSTGDSNGANRTQFWGKTDGTGVCPSGFRVPTEAEFAAEAIQNKTDGFHELKLPSAGYRYLNGTLTYYQNTYGYFWTKDPVSTTSATYFRMASTSVITGALARSNGAPVRCIKAL